MNKEYFGISGLENVPAHETEAVLKEAERQADNRVALFLHFLVFLASCIVLIIVNLVSNDGISWSKWIILGWAVGLLMHSICMFLTSVSIKYRSTVVKKRLAKLVKKYETPDIAANNAAYESESASAKGYE